MTPLVLLALAAGLPVVLAILLRVNSVYLFVSVAAGYMLQQFIGETTALTLRTFVRHEQIDMISAIALLCLPVLLSLLLLRKTMPTKELPLHLFLMVGSGLTLAASIVAVAPAAVLDSIKANPATHNLYRASDIIVTITATLALLLMWATLKHHKRGKKH